METYKQVRAIQRGFDVLVALNAYGALTIADLSKRTGINRTTLYRIVDTLESLGYIWKSDIGELVRLTGNVRRLSDGYDEGESLAMAASAPLKSLLSETAWPSSVATMSQEVMVIRETTHGQAALFVRKTTVGAQSPILTSAMGRAYISFCEPSEQKKILSGLAKSNSSESILARDEDYVKKIVDQTRSTGYGLSYGESDSLLGSVALPVRSEGSVVGGVNIVFLKAFINRQAAIDKFVPPLQRAAVAIERQLSAQRSIR